MKKNILFLGVPLLLVGAGCVQLPVTDDGATDTVVDEQQEESPVLMVDDEGMSTVDTARLRQVLSAYAAGSLSAEEETGLLYMREEEKLAHDVYAHLYTLWGQQIFDNIAQSESTHTDSVKALLDQYGLVDPAADTAAGEFTNTDLQALYDQLVEQGKTSLEEALKVGALIEEVDIQDLQEQIAQTDNEAITLVYENLMKGSRNHLRAFVRNLDRQGTTYSPEYLSETEYQEIVGSDVERGSNVGGSGNGQNGGRKGQGQGQGGQGGGGRR